MSELGNPISTGGSGDGNSNANQGQNGAGAGQTNGTGGGAGGEGGGQGGVGGASQTSWLDSLSAEYKENQSIKGFKSVEDLAKSYIHAQTMIGADKIPVPGKQATDSDWENVYKKLGRPETADKYEVKKAESHDDAIFNSFRDMAFKAGLNNKQLENLYNGYQEIEKAQLKAFQDHQKKILDDNIGALKKEWPDSEYNKNLDIAKTAVNTLLSKEEIKWLDDSEIGNDPMMIKLMHRLGTFMKEDRIKGEGGVSLNEGADSAQQKLNAILGDYKHPYFDSAHPNHSAAVQEVQGYYQALSKK